MNVHIQFERSENGGRGGGSGVHVGGGGACGGGVCNTCTAQEVQVRDSDNMKTRDESPPSSHPPRRKSPDPLTFLEIQKTRM